MRDLFPAEAEGALLVGVNELFASHREAHGSEIGPEIKPGMPYIVFANGAVKLEGEACAKSRTRLGAVRDTISAVRAAFPRAKSQCVVYRRLPNYEEWKDDPEWEMKAGFCLSIRIAALRKYSRGKCE